MFLGSGSDNDRQAMIFRPSVSILDGEATGLRLRTAGLVRVKGTVLRVTNAATAFTLLLEGQVADDTWTPLGPTTAMPAAAAGQVVTITADTVGYTMVRFTIANTPSGAGASVVSVTLSATWT